MGAARDGDQADHRVLGRQLKLWQLDPEVGPGLVLWSDRGTALTRAIESVWGRWHLARGYRFMRTPHIGRQATWTRSGQATTHDSAIFRARAADKAEQYLVKPANCPLHMHWFATQTRGHRELPLRVAEFGTIYRYERSGALLGLLRVRGISQDDGHVFCTREDAEDEVREVLALWQELLAVFGITGLSTYLGTRPGGDAEWAWNVSVLRRAAAALGLPVEEEPGSATEYAPRMGARFTDANGHRWSLSDLQLDTVMPRRLGIGYVAADGSRRTPVVIHRTVLGSMERFVAVVLELTQGWLPAWLAPEQVAILPVSDREADQARRLAGAARAAGVRTELFPAQQSVARRLHTCRERRVPLAVVLGSRDGDRAEVSHLREARRESLPRNGLVAYLTEQVRAPEPASEWS